MKDSTIFSISVFIILFIVCSFLFGIAYQISTMPNYRYVLYKNSKAFTICDTKTDNGFDDCRDGMSYMNYSGEYRTAK
jgi:hypothetical protein